jgi:hypothetical protein
VKILEVATTIQGTVYATVLHQGKTLRVFSPNKPSLAKCVRKTCSGVPLDDVLMDIALNFPTYLP